MRNYLSIKRKDFSSSIILLVVTVLFFVLIWNPEIELTSQAIPYFIAISILGVLISQLLSLNKIETSKSSRSYPVNNFLVRVSILFYILLILYFSWEFGTEIAELNREKGILVK